MKLFFTPKGHYLDLTNKLIKKIDKEYQLYGIPFNIFIRI